MAYCLRSFVQILEEVLHPDQHHKKWFLDHDNIPQIQSLLENGTFLRNFLDNSSPLIQDRIARLEDLIMNAAEMAEDTLETYLTSRLISYPEGQAFTISPPNLGEAIQAFKVAKQEVIKIMDACQRSDDNVLPPVLSTGYPDHNNLLVGVTEDLNQLSSRLTSLASELDIIPNLGEAIQALEVAKQEVIKIMDACQRSDDNVLPPVSSTHYPDHNNLLVGVTEDLNQLRSRLTSLASELDIIPIVGMGGMGKTTLARNLYDQFSSSNSHFDCFAWVTISQTYDPLQILSILLACTPEKTRQHNNDLVESLHKALYGRRYLIVLDDIWSREAWDDLQRAFPKEKNGSRIIMTTRENIVPDDVNSKWHVMHPLKDDDSWELLRGKIFGEESCPLGLEEVGKRIARSCGGLPLALQVIGGFLSQSHKSLEFWNHVAYSVRSLTTDDQISGIFSWSFAHLPHYLKPCFLYMAGFPEDREIPASKLIKLWVSEGFLYPICDKSLEEAGRIHLKALADRNLIFVRQKGKSGRAKSYGIHDILRDLCLKKAQEKRFLNLQTWNLQKGVLFFGRFFVSGFACEELPILTPLTRSFRSTYNIHNDVMSCLCLKLSLLRVLDLCNQDSVDEFPSAILQLVNLRYLHIWTINRYRIPVSFSVLRNLRTLIVGDCYITSLATILSDLPQLRHLKFFWVTENSVSYGVHENLQSLDRIHATDVVNLVGKLPNLRKLRIACSSYKEVIDLTCFHNLESLNCYGAYENGFSFAFPVSLKKLSIIWPGNIGQSHLDAIGKLPNLQILKIDLPYGNGTMDWAPIEGGFCALRYLEIENWDQENWLASEDHFPVLEHLVLKRCHHLIEIPNDFGGIETLKIIEVDKCLPSVFDSARKIYENQCEYGNTDLHLRFGTDLVELDKTSKKSQERWEREKEKKRKDEEKRKEEDEEEAFSLFRELFG